MYSQNVEWLFLPSETLVMEFVHLPQEGEGSEPWSWLLGLNKTHAKKM